MCSFRVYDLECDESFVLQEECYGDTQEGEAAFAESY